MPMQILRGCSVFCALAIAGCQSRSDDRMAERREPRESFGPSPPAATHSVARADTPPKFTFDGDDTAFLAEVRKAIPIGTSIDEAERILKANGFKCERRDGSDGEPGLSARHSKQRTLLTSWVWVLWLTEEDGKVSGITGSTAGLGP